MDSRRLLLRGFRLVDAVTDTFGSILVENGVIKTILAGTELCEADLVINGRALSDAPAEFPVLMPALIDLHAHFRDGPEAPSETLESASLAAAAGGYGTVVCMANTKPAIDTPEAAWAIKARSDTLGLIDLYPAMSLTKGMEGRELSEIAALPDRRYTPRLLSEDGKDVASDTLFLAAMAEARRLNVPISCHCDAGGPEAEAAKQRGLCRDIWSRIEENNATARALRLGRKAGCPLHIAHVSTKEAAELIRTEKAAGVPARLTCEASPHHLALTGEDARRLGDGSYGRVNPPLRAEADRQALIAAVLDGTIDAIATDHAPHTRAAKEQGAPGFTGLETAFSVCLTELVREDRLGLSALSRLMSAAPARILGLGDRGRLTPGLRADFLIACLDASRCISAADCAANCAADLRSRGNNSPFAGRELRGSILMTIHRGRIVFDGSRSPDSSSYSRFSLGGTYR